MNFDVIIVGGSYAGMAAALQLVRARRSVLVIDAGSRRNRFADSSHGFLTQDGNSPAAIAATAKTQLLAYPTVQWLEASATTASKTATGFQVNTAQQSYQAKRLILATGVTDQLPDIEGLAERWGKSIFHCPYCHGYELEQGSIGVLAASPLALHHALMLPDWGPTTLFTNQCFEPDAEQQVQLLARGVVIESGKVLQISGKADVQLTTGKTLQMAGLFTQPSTRVNSPLAAQLGCQFEQGPLGAFIQTSASKETTIPGVFACGDNARMAGSVAISIGDGSLAGAMTHQSLLFGTISH
ncbi:NAD(P)/FAD-dependent oxidoreductase [Rheinheimera sp. 1928-s]|uniref:NAD(P)/FAD-dependent oxidoreductase n=1 Tax=Rheinheimera sp. 1928-s TaxID=3033803 RepID=UPI0026062B74|nr:NAD(P)/FAD-dependent oxidoreductase [Rheinheimera sp. 1928-s]MDF3123501.1 NAD(P)/FAD-dependent oxidoreductase [Rheinheimera sp. 1928-s]